MVGDWKGGGSQGAGGGSTGTGGGSTGTGGGSTGTGGGSAGAGQEGDAGTSSPPGTVPTAKGMNVLFIAVDDLRPELSVYGKTLAKTLGDGLFFMI